MQTRYKIRSPTCEGKLRTVTRRRRPYSKVVLAALLIVTVAGNAASYILAWRGYETAEGVTVSLNTVFGAAIVGYLLKSLGEHASLNAHGIREIDETDGDE